MSLPHFPNHCRHLCLIGVFVVSLFTAGLPAVADDFCVDTEVFADDNEKSIASNTTLFHDGRVYDFPTAGNEVTIFAPKDGRVVLLDTRRRLRTELSVDQLYDFSNRLRAWGRTQDDKLLKFTVDPSFEQRGELASGRMTFSSRWMTYDLKTRPAATEAMSQEYRKFCDVFAHLNTLLKPGSLPPFARLDVNQWMAQGSSLPTEIRLTIPAVPKFGDRELKLATRHEYRETLSASDIKRVEQAGQQNVNFQTVSLAAYRGIEAKTANR